MRAAPPPVLAKVTGPLLPVVLSWSVNAADPVVVTEPENGVVWVKMTGLTVRAYPKGPVPPDASPMAPFSV